MTTRRDFVRRGSLFLLGAAILGPETIERLTWRRKSFALGGLGPRVWDVRNAAELSYALQRVGSGDLINLLDWIDVKQIDGGIVTRARVYPGLVSPDYFKPARRGYFT